MINIFLKAKHWQIFLLVFVVPIIFLFIIMGFITSDLIQGTNSDFTMVFNYMKFSMIIMIFFFMLFWGWLGSVAIGLQKKIPDSIKMKVSKFKIFFFIVFIYYLLFIVLINILLTNGFFLSYSESDLTIMGSFMLVIFPLHIFSVFCMLYSLYFVAKTIKTAELQKECTFKDFTEEFILILFYPIGLWIIQPRINKIYKDLSV